MAEQAYAYVTLIPVAKGFQQGIAKELGGVGGIGADAGKSAGTGFKGKFAGAIKGFAAPIAAGLGIAAVASFVKSSVGAASDLEESLNAVSVAYGEATTSVVALGEDAATRLGVTQSDFNAAAVRFSAFAGRVVGEGGNVSGFVDDVTTRAADFASVFNIEVSEALQVFQSGLSGEAEPLKRFGINLLDSEVSAYALRAGLIGVGEQMTEDIKTQARYGLLMESTANTAGDFANTSDGLANSQRILSANVTQLQADLGSVLLPVLADVTSGMLPLLDVVRGFFGFIQENIPTIATFAGIIGVLTIAFNAQRIATAAYAAVQTVLNFVLAANPIGIIIVAVAALAAGIVFLATKTQFFQTVWAALGVAWEAVTRTMGIVFKSFIDAVVEVWTGIKTVFISVMTFIGDAFKSYINGWIGLFEGFVNGAIRGINFLIQALNRISFSLPSWVPGIGGKSFGVNIREISTLNLPRLAEGGFVNSPTTALIGEAGPEVVIPLDRFERMVGLDDRGASGTVNYYAAPNKSFDAEQELRLAMTRARVLA